jgi:hypothetical protein
MPDLGSRDLEMDLGERSWVVLFRSVVSGGFQGRAGGEELSVAWRGEFGRELPKKREDLGAEVRITGASKGDRLRGSGN